MSPPGLLSYEMSTIAAGFRPGKHALASDDQAVAQGHACRKLPLGLEVDVSRPCPPCRGRRGGVPLLWAGRQSQLRTGSCPGYTSESLSHQASVVRRVQRPADVRRVQELLNASRGQRGGAVAVDGLVGRRRSRRSSSSSSGYEIVTGGGPGGPRSRRWSRRRPAGRRGGAPSWPSSSCSTPPWPAPARLRWTRSPDRGDRGRQPPSAGGQPGRVPLTPEFARGSRAAGRRSASSGWPSASADRGGDGLILASSPAGRRRHRVIDGVRGQLSAT